MAQFIKIHPHYLMLVRQHPENFVGKLSFSVEQYGLIIHDFVFNLQLTPLTSTTKIGALFAKSQPS